jgi:hypothetical protein
MMGGKREKGREVLTRNGGNRLYEFVLTQYGCFDRGYLFLYHMLR